jgi:hypothetical protein
MMVTFTVPLGSSGDNLEIQPTLWGPCRLSYHGELKALAWFSGKLHLQTGDKQHYEVTYRPRFIDCLPTVFVNGIRSVYPPPLAWWMYVIAGIMIIPILMSVGIWKMVFQDSINLFSGADLSLILCTALPYPILPGLLIIYFGPRVLRRAADRRYLALVFIVVVVFHFLLSAACSFGAALLTGA